MVLLGCFIFAFITFRSHAIDPARIMHSAQTMVNDAFSQHERIITDRYTKPLVTIVKHPQSYRHNGKKKSVKVQP
jgi:hypothetical protein